MEEPDESTRRLKLEIQAGIDEADQGQSAPFDLEAIKTELNAEFDAKGIPQ